MNSAKLIIASFVMILASIAVTLFFVLTSVGGAKAGGRSSAVETIDDSTINARVKARFAEDRSVSAMAIGVETLHGEVQLSGFVETAGEKAKAETIARGISGVTSVRNDIVISVTPKSALPIHVPANPLQPIKGPIMTKSTVGEYIDDSTITARVKLKFADNEDVSATAIGVETLRGLVQLSGFVKTENEKARAEMIARNTPGVKNVRNDIVVLP